MATKLAPLIVIVGQTASGKTALALELAQKFNGEIICADSRTIYKEMNIGTAKPSSQEQGSIKHYLLDIVSPDERFNANDFKQLANEAINDIASKDKTPFLVGGTGLYISSLIYDFNFTGEGDNKLRNNCLIIGLQVESTELRKRINNRIDQMLDQGLEEEVRKLAAKYGFDAPGMNGICYRQWSEYFAGEQSLDELRQKLYTVTWQYARRQKTWFKRDDNIHWITSVDQAVRLVQQFLIQ